MPNAEAYKALQSGRTEWEAFRAKAFKGGGGKILTEGRIDLRGADLRYMDLSGYDLSRVDFSAPQEKNGKSKRGESDKLSEKIAQKLSEKAHGSNGKSDMAELLAKADLSFANLSGAYLFGSRFSGTRMEGVNMSAANIAGAEFEKALIDGNSALRSVKSDSKTIFRSCKMDGADLSGADMSGADFEGSSLHDADLSGTRFFQSRLGNTSWRGARIDQETDFNETDFPDHAPGLDLSEHMSLPSGANWTHARWIGDRTLMILSALGLTLCFIFISAVRAAHSGLAPESVFGLITPASIHALMIGFAAILAGIILYRLRCPEEIKNFSAAHWVHLAGKPRPVYLAASLKERSSAFASLGLVVFGLFVLAFALKAIVLAIVCPACFA